MPATSQAQMRFMYAVQNGSVKKPGLSPTKAKEFTSGVSYKSLPATHHLAKASHHISKALDMMVKKKKKKKV